MNSAESIKVDEEKSTDKLDGAVATIMAFDKDEWNRLSTKVTRVEFLATIIQIGKQPRSKRKGQYRICYIPYWTINGNLAEKPYNLDQTFIRSQGKIPAMVT